MNVPIETLREQPGVQGLVQLAHNAIDRINELERENGRLSELLANQLANQAKTCGSPMAELHCLCGAEWESRGRDWELVTPPRPVPPQQSQKWAVFCAGCRKEWSVPYKHSGKSVCSECESKATGEVSNV